MKKAAQIRDIAVVTSDCHLQERAWHSRTNLSGDSLHAFEFICDYAIEHDLPILAAGDIIDKQKLGSDVPGFVRKMMDKLRKASVPFGYIQGQHELQKSAWFSELSDWPDWLHRRALRSVLPGHYVYGIDWTPHDQVVERLSEVPKDATVLLMHQVCHEFMGGIAQAELYWEMIPGNVKMLIVGDFHEKHANLVRKNADGKDLSVLAPGSTCLQSITEPVLKQFWVLRSDLSARSVKIPSRPFLQPPELSLPEDVDGFCEAVSSQIDKVVSAVIASMLPAELRKPIVYVRYSYQLEDAYQRLVKAVGDKAHLFTKELRPKTPEQIEAREERKQMIEGGLIGALPSVAEEGTARFDISRRLLETRNPRQVLADIRKEFLEA